MSHNRDLSAAAAQLGFHSSNIGIGSEAPRYALDVYNSNLLVSGPSAGNIILEDRGVGDSSRPFHVVSSDGGKFVINRSNRNASGTTTSSVNSLTLSSSGNLGLGPQTNPAANIHIADLSANGYELKITGNALQFNRSSNSYIDQLHDTGSILFRTTSSNTEAMRITSAGNIGINDTAPSQKLNVGGNIMLEGSDQYLYLTNVGTGNAGMYIRGRDATSELRSHSTGIFTWEVTGSEKMRIDSSGRLLLTSGTDVRIELGTTGSTGTNNRNHLRGDGSNMKYNCCSGGGHFFEANGGERMRISSNGHVNIGDGYIVSNSGLHVGRSSGGTAAGESVIAATLGNDSSMVSALLTVKNAGNRGSQGHGSGSPLAKFEFNNGTAFEIDKYGRRTLQYQPACKVSIDTNGTGGGNSAQTGNTVVPFNSTGYGYNIGNHFNTSNHTFTAPLSGRYLVLLSLNVIGDNIVYIYKNGTVHQGGEYRSNPVGSWEHCELSGIVDCSANDTIKTHSYLLSSSGGRKFNGGTNPGSTWDTLSIYYLG